MSVIEFAIYFLTGSLCTIIGFAGSRLILKQQMDHNRELLEYTNKLISQIQEHQHNEREWEHEYMKLKDENNFYKGLLDVAGVKIEEYKTGEYKRRKIL